MMGIGIYEHLGLCARLEEIDKMPNENCSVVLYSYGT